MSGLNPQRRGMAADISLEVLFIVHVGDSAITTVTIESYTHFLPLDFLCALNTYMCVRRVGYHIHTEAKFSCSWRVGP